jgi:SulP family sulfate permease
VTILEEMTMSVLLSRRPSWFAPRVLRTEVLAGLVVALALIPEAISFSILAGVDPRVGLFASFTMAVTIAFCGGRPAMISAATGAVALVVGPLAREHGLRYLIAAVILGGLFQVGFALLGVAKLMRFIPRSVMVGFVNALAILIFAAQVPHLIGVSWLVYPLVAVALAVMVLLPRLTTAVPAPLVAIVALTVFTVVARVTVPTVGDEGALPDSLPTFGLPDVPFTVATLQIIAPYALGIALVGLLESLMTAKLVDDITDTRSSKTRESWGQGVANIVTGFFGGMGGCAMIGQTMINVKASGARTRLSTFLAGVFLHSVAPATLKRMPWGETIVMTVTVVGTLGTGNLAVGVVLGVLTAMVIFARRVAHLAEVTSVLDPDGGTRVYTVHGALFFASSNDLVTQFDYRGDPGSVVIDLTDAHIWDASSVAALDAVTTRYAARGTTVEIVGLNEASARMHGALAGQLKVGH